MARAHCPACAFAEDAAFGIGSAMQASPMTCTSGTSVDSKVAGSTGHQP